MKHLVAAACLALSACVAVPAMRLDTSWRGEAHPGVMSNLAFDLDGTASWDIELPAGRETYELKYVLASNPDRTPAVGALPPSFLDFSGFDRGPLAGKTLYGIAHWDEETLLYEAAAGDPGEGGDVVRPKAFTAEARRFTRVR